MLENYCRYTLLHIDNNQNAVVSFRKMRAMLIVILVGLCALCYKSCPSSVSGYQCICKCYDDIMECRNSCNMENGCWITCATTYSACLRDCVNSN